MSLAQEQKIIQKAQDYSDHLNNAYRNLIISCKMICPEFIVDNDNKEALMKMVVWACQLRSDIFPDLDPEKGLFLFGDKGVGKSIAIEGLRNCLKHGELYFKNYKAEDISEDYALGNTGDIFHSFEDNGRRKSYSICIDDMGFERLRVIHFGNEICPIATVISKRYDLYQRNRLITHITSNLNGIQIERLYGDRIRDRIREMCNEIVFKGTSRRK